MDPIDGEIRRALAVDPSPEFLARVRTHIASEPVPGRRFPWMVVAPAVFAMALLAIVLIVRRTSAPAPALLTARFPVGAVGTMPAVESVYARHARDAGTRFEELAAPKAEGRRREPEVLIAADEAKALRQLILGVREGRIDLARVLEATPITAAEPAPLDNIAIPPITITPLAGEQGVRQ